MNRFVMRNSWPDDQAGAYHVCLKTGDYGRDGEPFYREDPDALGRIFVGPYLAYEPELALILEDERGVCGYAFGAFESKSFYSRYDTEWRPKLCAEFPMPGGDPARWTRIQHVHSWYHQPDYFCPEPHHLYPSHLHIDLLDRAQGKGWGRRMLEEVMRRLRERGSAGAHLGVSACNQPAFAFYEHLGFNELARTGEGNGEVIYMGKRLNA
jgi:ribosomal protein S18 acetylase RimI-like enzyme